MSPAPACNGHQEARPSSGPGWASWVPGFWLPVTSPQRWVSESMGCLHLCHKRRSLSWHQARGRRSDSPRAVSQTVACSQPELKIQGRRAGGSSMRRSGFHRREDHEGVTAGPQYQIPEVQVPPWPWAGVEPVVGAGLAPQGPHSTTPHLIEKPSRWIFRGMWQPQS